MPEKPRLETVLTPPNIPRRLERAASTAVGLSLMSVLENGAEYPVGAVALGREGIVGSGYALDRTTGDELMHAEVAAALTAQAKNQKFTTIVTSMEPCIQCQDYLHENTNVKRIAYVLGREESIRRHHVNDHGESAAERVGRLGLRFEIIHINHPSLQMIGQSALDSTVRDRTLKTVSTSAPDMVKMLADMHALGHSL
jgi:tRNA(Arg) A34 adenosine deaminase TadA